MSPSSAFWDASAIVPVCLQEPTSARARKLADQFEAVVWWATSVEVYSAFARLHRSGALNDIGRLVAVERLHAISSRWREIVPSDIVRDRAETILDAHPLRAADSLQLAAALVWCRNRSAGRTFISSDARLCEAAALEGFTILGP